MRTFKATVEGLKALRKKPHPQRVDYFDPANRGLCIRIGPREATWYFLRRIDGKLTRLRLGSDDELAALGERQRKASFTVAREKKASIEDMLAAGVHPKAEQARERAEVRAAREMDLARLTRTVAEAWRAAGFPAETQRKKRRKGKLADTTRADYGRALDEFVEAFGDEDIGTMTRGALKRHLDKIKSRSDSAANRAAVVIRLLFAYATDRYDLNSNPAAELANPAGPTIRKRTLGRDELRVLWKACELAGYPYGHALRLAVCTGQRMGEVGNIRRSDLESGGEYWIQTENKTDNRIDIYLADHAKAILNDCPNFGRAAPFFTAGSGDSDDKTGKGLKGIHSDRWNKTIPRHIEPRIAEAAEALGLEPIGQHWTPHDLRRTVRTGLTGWCVGITPDTAERVLNHTIGGLRAVYDHADYRPVVAEALEAWDAELSLLLEGKPSSREQRTEAAKKARRAKVIPMRKRA